MGPTKKSRNVKKRLFKVNEKPHDMEENKDNKSKIKKRKLSDMLGSQWSKEELEHFYEAYRKYGKDWKKVASIFRNRSVDMVEALYNMNRAYLSLPDGMATVAGLIAMMTDHYNILDESDSDRERNDGPRTSYKLHRRDRGKHCADTSSELVGSVPDHMQNHSTILSNGCLSLLKRSSGDPLADNRPRAVGKRTPRIPVTCLRETDALTLAKASQRGGSPQISGTPGKMTEHTRPSPLRTGQKRDAEPETSRTDHFSGGTDLESLRTMPVESRVSAIGALVTEVAGDIEAQQKVKTLQGDRTEKLEIESFQSDGVREACSATDRGYYIRNIKYETDIEVTDEKTRHAFQRPRKKSHQLSRDESCAVDALRTLADISLKILLPSSAAKSESGVHAHKQEREDASHESTVHMGMSKNHENSKKFRTSLKGEKGSTDGVDLVNRGCANQALSVRKRKYLAEEVSVEDTNRSVVQQLASLPKRGKFTTDFSALSKDLGKTVTNMPESTSRSSTVDCVTVSAKSRNRRKMGLPKAFIHTESSKTAGNQCLNKYSLLVNEEAADWKVKLSHCLSSRMLRRWCAFEWFYSAIDYPWFARCEFGEYLDHVQLGHITRLTRVEWSVIRSSLGKPRRLSKRFLLEERKRLELYRESVRAHYAELHAGVREGLPTDLARPLLVGQHVSACHPKTREIHNGKVLTVNYNRCRVQFDRSDLGVEIVQDIDCMPLNPCENMPEDLRMQNVFVDKLCNALASVKPRGLFPEWKVDHSKIASYESSETANGISPIASLNYPAKQEKGDTFDATIKAKDVANKAAAQQSMSSQPCTLLHIQEREADIKALADLNRVLDKKTALLTELRQMNEEACGKVISDCEFRKQYAMVLLQLQDTNDQVASALLCLRQRNTYQGNSWSRSNVGPLGSLNMNQDPGSYVIEIVEGSRQKARMMVDEAVKEMISLKERDERTGGSVTFAENQHSGADFSLSRTRCSPPNPGNHSLEYQDPAASCMFEPTNKVNGSSPMMSIFSNVSPSVSEAQLPSELISACVSTLLMIQNCTERQYPPGEIARIMESAVTSLQPCCSQNLSIYREIETCMCIIKNQMLALVPTSSSAFCAEVSV